MKTKLLKALSKIPGSIKTTAKAELKQQVALMPLKAQIHMENKLKSSLTASVGEYKDIPGQIMHEFKRQSFHQGQTFINNNTYFEQYHYQPQQQRYNSTPQPNLAEILYNAEQNTRRY